jgi:membrane protease YdiL (CAAX protease family)
VSGDRGVRIFDLLTPERTGLKFERLVALALLAVALTSTLLPVFASRRAPAPRTSASSSGDDMDRDLAALKALAEKEPHHPLIIAGTLWLLAGIGVSLALQVRFARRLRQPGGAFPPEDDATRKLPPWGLADFGVVLLFQWVGLAPVFVFLGLWLGPGLAIEGESRIPLADERRIVFGATAAVDSRTTEVRVPGAKGPRAQVTRKDGHATLEVLASELDAPLVSLDGRVVFPGDHRLRSGDRIQVGAVHAVYEAPSLALQYVLGAAMSLALAAFVVLLVRRRGGTLADLGLVREGALGEIGRGLVGYLGAVPLIVAALVGSTLLCRALGVPFEEHPVLKSLEDDHSWATIASVVFLAAIVAPIQEEILYRGFLTRALRRPYPSRLAAGALSSFFFGSLHPGLANVLPISVVGGVFAAVFLTSRRGSLLGAIAAHAAFNAVNITTTVVLLKATTGG